MKRDYIDVCHVEARLSWAEVHCALRAGDLSCN